MIRKKTKLIKSTPSANPSIELQTSGKQEQSPTVGHVTVGDDVDVVVDFVVVLRVVGVIVAALVVVISSSVVDSAVMVVSSSVVVSESVVVLISSVVVVGSGGGSGSSETPNHLMAAKSMS